MYYITVSGNNEIMGFHYSSGKESLLNNEIEITEEDYNNYSGASLRIFKYKYDNGIEENAQLVE